MIEFPKPVMKTSELKAMGFPEDFLMTAYRAPDQNFATKLNPMKSNSPILFDTHGFNAWLQKRIKAQVNSIPRGK